MQTLCILGPKTPPSSSGSAAVGMNHGCSAVWEGIARPAPMVAPKALQEPGIATPLLFPWEFVGVTRCRFLLVRSCLFRRLLRSRLGRHLLGCWFRNVNLRFLFAPHQSCHDQDHRQNRMRFHELDVWVRVPVFGTRILFAFQEATELSAEQRAGRHGEERPLHLIRLLGQTGKSPHSGGHTGPGIPCARY